MKKLNGNTNDDIDLQRRIRELPMELQDIIWTRYWQSIYDTIMKDMIKYIKKKERDKLHKRWDWILEGDTWVNYGLGLVRHKDSSYTHKIMEL